MPQLISCISPVDNKVYVEREGISDAELDRRCHLAREALPAWQRRDLAARADICRKALKYFEDNSVTISEEISWQMGRPIQYTGGEISGLLERGHYMIDIAEAALADQHGPEIEGIEHFIRRTPLGLVLTVAPWNYPLLTAVNSVLPALMAGNAVLLKPSAQTPLTGEHFEKAFREAGLEEGLLQCVHISHDQTAELIRAKKVEFSSFTGSVAAGAMIEKAAAGNFQGLGLELGGKDPAYVRADLDSAQLSNAVANLVDGAFFNSGQSCCGIERIYVQQDNYQKFCDEFIAQVNEYKLGNPLEAATSLGPVVRPGAANWVRQQTQAAVKAGATACIDPSSFVLDRGDSAYLAPQVLLGVDHSMSVMKEESFGPVVGIMSVSSDEQAVELMNDSDLGLTASIWSNERNVVARLGEQIETGTVFMNRCDYLDPALAWTGVKNTGRGASLSVLGYQQLTRPKSFHFKST